MLLASLTVPETPRETMSAPIATAMTSRPMAIPTISSMSVTPCCALKTCDECMVFLLRAVHAMTAQVFLWCACMSGTWAVVGGGISAGGIGCAAGSDWDVLQVADVIGWAG